MLTRAVTIVSCLFPYNERPGGSTPCTARVLDLTIIACNVKNQDLPCDERDENSMRRERSDPILSHRVQSALHVHPDTSCANTKDDEDGAKIRVRG